VLLSGPPRYNIEFKTRSEHNAHIENSDRDGEADTAATLKEAVLHYSNTAVIATAVLSGKLTRELSTTLG
jgi:hypothetical protein